MSGNYHRTEKTRRTFLKEVAAYGGAIALAGYATEFR